MIKVWMLSLSLISLSAQATDFSHIKLDPQFEEYLKSPGMKSHGKKTLSNLGTQKSVQSVSSAESGIISALLGSSGDSPFPTDGEDSPLYQEIRRHLETAHQDIGLSEIRNIDRINQQFNLGSQNFSGFSWQKPFGVVQVYADRQVTPNLFGSNWLVQDSFTLEIEATTFLERLNQAGGSFMDASEIGAFAGITFKRVYTYYHYAKSYNDGLRADFTKLFLPFVRFNQSGMEKMGHEEIMKREDNWTASAGGLIRTPPLYNLSFSAGILSEASLKQTASIQSTLTDNDSDHRFQVGVMSKKNLRAGLTLELQLDFFRLLQISLLRYDLNYEFTSGKELVLGITPKDWLHIKQDRPSGDEFKKILKGSASVSVLEPYVVRLEESSSRALESKGSVLIFGKVHKTKTEQIRVIKDQVVKVFYKSYSQSVKVVQNFVSRIFSAVVYKLIKLPMGATNAAMFSRQLTMEYEATHPQSVDPKVIRIEKSEQFSFVLTQSYQADSTDRWIDKKYRTGVINFVDFFTLLPKDYKTIIRNEQLKGPMTVESNVRVEKAGFDFLLGRNENNVFAQLAKVCGLTDASDWITPNIRNVMLNKDQDDEDGCVKDLGLKFLDFKKDYTANLLKPSLAKFKIFMDKYFVKTKNIRELAHLFGEEHTFIHGTLTATKSTGDAFFTSFSSGEFRGLGVIDNFKRTTGSRAPASIVSE
ncbi:MAG TPA: hypothetical protein VNJ01_12265 [Bacteriovoracaceae bacterium]|nr:hypothetical protein [Bacteriovoracaceae bacterium]